MCVTATKNYYRLTILVTVLSMVFSTYAFAQTCGQGSTKITINGSVPATSQVTCPNTEIAYGIQGSPLSSPSWTLSPTSAGTFKNGISTGPNVRVIWSSSGTLRMDYPDFGGNQCEQLFYTVTTVNPGTVSITGANPVCSGNSTTLTVSNAVNASGYIWQRCTSGCTNDANWTTATGTVSGWTLTVSNVTQTAIYRTKVVSSICSPNATYYSNQVTVTALSSQAINVVINNPGPVCSTQVPSMQFYLVEGSSTVGSSPTYEWYRNGSPAVGNASSDPKQYIPASSSYYFQNGETMQLKVTSGNSCDSPRPAWSNVVTISITSGVNPTMSIGASATNICDGESVTFSASASHPISGSITWSLGGVPQSSGPTFTITNFQSSSSYNVTASATVTGTCLLTTLASSTYNASNITVNPKPIASASSQSICSGQPATINVTSNLSGTVLSWSVIQSSGITGASGGSGVAPVTITQTLSNSTGSNGTATYTITPSKGGCVGASITPVVTVKPRPTITPSPASQTICSGVATAISLTSNVAGTTIGWSVSQTGVTGATSGNGTSINQTLTTTSPILNGSATYTISSIANGCSGNTVTVPVTIKKRPAAQASNQQITSGKQTFIQITDPNSGSGTTFSWTVTSSNATGASAGSGSTIAQTLTSTGANASVTYTITPSANGCTGTPITAVVTFLGPNDYNWVRGSNVLVSGKKTQTDLDQTQIAIGHKNVNWAYIDGFGRAMQDIQVQGSPLTRDVVTPHVFDKYGREFRKYLPVVVNENTGNYKLNDDIVDGTTGNYKGIAAGFYPDARPFNETSFEPSPLDRPSKDFGPGADWFSNNKSVNHVFSTNVHNSSPVTLAGEKIVAWKIVSNLPVRNTDPALNAGTGYYPTGRLNIESTKDEQGNEVREYVDREGQLILRKVQVVSPVTSMNSNTEWALTYYIYDDDRNLRFVLQPELSKKVLGSDTYNPTQTDLDNGGFQYKYDDARRRMSEKKMPGAAWIYMVYDARDRVVLTQDGNLRVNNQWLFKKYDEFNRPILTGIKDTTVVLTQQQMQSAVNNHYAKAWTKYGETYIGAAAGSVHGYTVKSYPVFTSGAVNNVNHYLTVTYYDQYSFKSLWVGNYNYRNESLTETDNSIVYTQPATEFQRVTGQVTGTKVKVLDSKETWLKSVTYYDDKFRVIQTVGDNYMGGLQRQTNLVDFSGKILRTKTTSLAWKDFLHLTASGSVLTCTAATADWGHSGAVTQQQLPAGKDGWMEVTITATNTARMIGLSDVNTNSHYNTIDYALYPYSDGKLYIYENGARVTSTFFSSYFAGDVLRIERTGTQIRYYRNGSLLHPSAIPSTTALMVDASMHTTGGTIGPVEASFATITERRFKYDHAGRLVQTFHKLNGEPEILLAHNKYNELGQLEDKKLHSTQVTASDARQSVDFRYNVRGWLTSINNSTLAQETGVNDDKDDLFGMQLGYNTAIGTSNSLLHNGNISGIKWSSNPEAGPFKQFAYNYQYDPMNRILGASYKVKNTAWDPAPGNGFSESNYSYDLNGNILGLTRYDERGNTQVMDNLIYDYGTNAPSNQLLKVSEKTGIDAGDVTKGFIDGVNTGNDYTYDANGNMTSDQNKNVAAISYNHLNLPINVIVANKGRVGYIYDALGTKLKLEVIDQTNIRKETFYNGESISSGETKATTVAQDWHFNANTMSWTKNTHVSTLTWNAGGYIVGAVSNIDPNITSPVVSIPIDRNAVIKIRMKVTTKTYRAQMFFTTTASTGVAEIKSLVFPLVPVNDQFNEYVLDMSQNPYWTGNLRQLRLDPINGSVAGESFAVDYIQIVRTEEVKSPSMDFVNHEEGRIVTSAATPDYQYNIKDHLGNVRVTFSTKDYVDAAIATLEPANAAAESGKFLYYDEAIKVQSNLFDHTNDIPTDPRPDEPTGVATRLLGGTTNSKYGLARSLAVMPGDVISMEVYAKYLDTQTANWNQALTNLMASIANGTAPPGTYVDGGNPGSMGNILFPFPNLLTRNDAGTGPKAYLNYLIFDRNYVLKNGGYKRLSSTPKENGTNVRHELLSFKDGEQITIAEAGYIYIYISNENETPVEVYFDDFKVTHTKKTSIVQSDDYYPFGLTFNSYKRESSLENKVKFQGQEHTDDLGLRWVAFKWRNHQPDIGRFFNVDPLAEKYYYNSLYAFSENRVIDGRELEGLEWISTQDSNGKTTGYMWDPKNAYTADENGNQVLKEGYYNQAIFFSENGTFDKDSKYNIGSSTATVYKADGTTETFDASTYPSDQDSYATVPEGDYEATVGLHKSSYTALRVHDVGNTQDRIELGEPNPSDPSRTYAEGINIHKPGLNNLTGLTSTGQPCSAGCFLIDRDNWNSFIQIFSNEEQKNNPVGISLSRTYSEAKVSQRGGPRFNP